MVLGGRVAVVQRLTQFWDSWLHLSALFFLHIDSAMGMASGPEMRISIQRLETHNDTVVQTQNELSLYFLSCFLLL